MEFCVLQFVRFTSIPLCDTINKNLSVWFAPSPPLPRSALPLSPKRTTTKSGRADERTSGRVQHAGQRVACPCHAMPFTHASFNFRCDEPRLMSGRMNGWATDLVVLPRLSLRVRARAIEPNHIVPYRATILASATCISQFTWLAMSPATSSAKSVRCAGVSYAPPVWTVWTYPNNSTSSIPDKLMSCFPASAFRCVVYSFCLLAISSSFSIGAGAILHTAHHNIR